MPPTATSEGRRERVGDGYDLVVINPGGRQAVYQELGRDLAAVEPPLWCRLIARYALARGGRPCIVDSEADELEPAGIARRVVAHRPRLAVVAAFGHQP